MQRTGLTLVEVLVAIFIMGIGLIALLTLFPIGILRMAQAIRNEKTALAATTATSIGNIYNVRNDSQVISAGGAESDLFSNPGALITPTALKPADPFSESYPVFADAIGRASFTGTPQEWVGGIQGYLRRRPVSFASTIVAMNQNFTIWDDITFDSTFDPGAPGPATRPGTPKVIAPSNPLAIQRDPRYSWAYLLRRPQTNDRSVVDCSVVVFDKRATLTLTETIYESLALFDPVKNTILIDLSGATTVAPNIRPGDWLYDATLYSTPATVVNPALRPNGSAHSYFYRVVAAEDIVAGGKRYAKYEVQTPIRGFTQGPSANCITPGTDPITGTANAVYTGTVIYMEGVAEVFEKGPVRVP